MLTITSIYAHRAASLAGTTSRSVPAVLFLCLILLCTWPGEVLAEELEMINRPVNTEGMTGLLYTTAPYTLPRKTIEVGAGIITEKSHVPDYTVTGYPVVVSYGLTDDMEIALRASYMRLDAANTTKSRAAGDTSVSYKWNVRKQQEYSIVPAVALFCTGIFPTGDRAGGTNTVDHWGARLGISVGSEIPIEDYTLGIYADGQITVQDLSDSELRDRNQIFNAGVLLPISKYRNLQMFIEYNALSGDDVSHQYETNYSAVTYGIRVVNARFNLSFGAQFVHRSVAGYEDSSRIISLASYKF
jgi:hypothetical protein